MKTEMRNKAGYLTAYAFACGYVDTFERSTFGGAGGEIHSKLYKEHGVYHVQAFNQGKRVTWESFKTLTKARNFFRKTIAALGEAMNMRPTPHEKDEWLRCAFAARRALRNNLARAFEDAAKLDCVPLPLFDTLQTIYRSWLNWNLFDVCGVVGFPIAPEQEA